MIKKSILFLIFFSLSLDVSAGERDFRFFEGVWGKCKRFFYSESEAFKIYSDIIMDNAAYPRTIHRFEPEAVFRKYPELQKVPGLEEAVREQESNFYRFQGVKWVDANEKGGFDAADTLLMLVGVTDFFRERGPSFVDLIDMARKQGAFKDFQTKDFVKLFGDQKMRELRELYADEDIRLWFPLHYYSLATTPGLEASLPLPKEYMRELYLKSLHSRYATSDVRFIGYFGGDFTDFSKIKEELTSVSYKLGDGKTTKDYQRVTTTLTDVFGFLAGESWVNRAATGERPYETYFDWVNRPASDKRNYGAFLNRWQVQDFIQNELGPNVQSSFKNTRNYNQLLRYFRDTPSVETLEIFKKLEAVDAYLKINGSSLGIDLQKLRAP